MKNLVTEFDVPESTMENWQEILNILTHTGNIPAALIMRLRDDDIEVLFASRSEGNPAIRGRNAGYPAPPRAQSRT